MVRLHHLPAIVALTIALPSTAFAYIGPGAGISAIGTALALIAALLLAIVGFVWYPVKRLLGSRRKTQPVADDAKEKR
jgi:hypothetical protein